MNRSLIGFDRKIELEWMDAAADCVGRSDDIATVRRTLNAALDGALDADATAARAKTVGVLIRLWVNVHANRRSHRDRGLSLLARSAPAQRLCVHWGTAIATYPFFYEVANNVGRQLPLQGSVSLASLTRRMSEAWGERSTVERALQRVVRTMVAWGALRETSERGTFLGPEAPATPPTDVCAWLLEAALLGSGLGSIPLRQVGGQPCLFPFRVELSPRDVREQPGIELHREGVDREILTLR